jgi:glucose/arabinose dehydrogenase
MSTFVPALAFLAAFAASVKLRLVVEGLDRPVVVAQAGDGSGRLFIAQQGGQIRLFDGTRLLPVPFLDLSSFVSRGSEQGLLGLAFHPGYETNGFFYVNLTDAAGDTQILRFTASADPDIADPASAVPLLAVDQPFANHNGGQLAFGPDGKLWIGLGDGGSAGDPGDRAQSGSTLLGKILRVDVDLGLPYAIPEDNPFIADSAVRDEIWALGLRNPWRFSFDRLEGDLFIADVGQNVWEEVSLEAAASGGGRNYGWRRMEGSHCFDPASGCNEASLVLPILEYSHSFGCSVTGGYRYRGSEMPDHFGTYFFGDFCSGRIWGGIESAETGSWTATELLDSELLISTFGEDERGELYAADLNGALYRIHGETFCSVREGSLEIANFSTRSVAVELAASSGGSRFAVGSIVLGANSSLDGGPVDLPPADYALSCMFRDPATGALRSKNVRRLKLE